MSDLAEKQAEQALLELYRQRLRDRRQAQTKRRKAINSGPRKLSSLLPEFFQGDPQAVKRMEETKAIMAWEVYVGESAARFSQALRIRNATLVVRVRDPLWMQQMSMLKQELLKKYWVQFPKLDLKDIFFTVSG
jgi:predicted nucleic acid-binding Zn ribbon protein